MKKLFCVINLLAFSKAHQEMVHDPYRNDPNFAVHRHGSDKNYHFALYQQPNYQLDDLHGISYNTKGIQPNFNDLDHQKYLEIKLGKLIEFPAFLHQFGSFWRKYFESRQM